ncbi:hypothetical protein CDL15_Pgr010115 [Punica granatum]|uniref:Uncharacterized protein n=1 Tax=Punica granatum TaxID=22663 RepID=A0A218WW08_PUNGR|nr:hypothetical protein CDL15_Pgr010115 [Punica granatum]PKI48418.1 hypothetical protein CRG98_031190 [Punica granatum]
MSSGTPSSSATTTKVTNTGAERDRLRREVTEKDWNSRANSVRLALSYRDAIRSWLEQTLPWRGLGRGPVEAPHTP